VEVWLKLFCTERAFDDSHRLESSGENADTAFERDGRTASLETLLPYMRQTCRDFTICDRMCCSEVTLSVLKRSDCQQAVHEVFELINYPLVE